MKSLSLADIEALFVSAMRQLQVMQDIPNYENKNMCSTCGGACCKSLAGINSPEQFGAPDKHLLEENLMEALKSGRYTIDWWDPDNRLPQTYYIRPSSKGHEGQVTDPSYGGECNFLTGKGCELGHEERPTQCTTLEPKMKGDQRACEQNKSKFDMVKLWIPYQDIMEIVLKRARDEDLSEQYYQRKHKKANIKKTDKISIGNNTFETLVAVSEEEHIKGLMGKSWPPPVMIFPYKNAEPRKFWMHKTISPLDIIFCKSNRVIGIFEGKPMSTALLGPDEPSDLVVELPLGTAEKCGIRIGDKINIKYSIQTIAKRYEREMTSFS